MYLRGHRRNKKGESYEYWTLVESVRTTKGPRQRTVAYIGKERGLERQERLGWEQVIRMLDDQDNDGAQQTELFEVQCDEREEKPQWREVNLREISVEGVREFGKVYMALALWRRLHLQRFFAENLPVGRESVNWSDVMLIVACGRFCEQSSESALAERWYGSTALEDFIGVDALRIDDNRLYRGLDELLPFRSKLFSPLRERYESLFGSRFEFLLYDITSTYFEGQCSINPQAKHGYSGDKRPDCKQVCIGLVVSAEGLPLAYEVFDGNRADVTTLEEIVDAMQEHYGAAERIWVMDRGMVSEENLDYLKDKQAQYIVGTPKARLKKNCWIKRIAMR